ncbi:hypothetical protein RND71_018215 [Anisodus tanguticus]|uniref:Uncharacterized protein n=1 Tax=Anisodus tanguticus TaxID=243964 RepID=A0AAE1S4Z4_9SOLA|nr:hypothetical protein RND71_018215 [Anisodus tanguticus]
METGHPNGTWKSIQQSSVCCGNWQVPSSSFILVLSLMSGACMQTSMLRAQ